MIIETPELLRFVAENVTYWTLVFPADMGKQAGRLMFKIGMDRQSHALACVAFRACRNTIFGIIAHAGDVARRFDARSDFK